MKTVSPSDWSATAKSSMWRSVPAQTSASVVRRIFGGDFTRLSFWELKYWEFPDYGSGYETRECGVQWNDVVAGYAAHHVGKHGEVFETKDVAVPPVEQTNGQVWTHKHEIDIKPFRHSPKP